jgi:murein DD-endopeptidase MepM/ murein hydrolase activator NlpD
MKKYSEDEVTQLISQLFGQPISAPPTMLPAEQPKTDPGKYQLPLHVGKGVKTIGTFAPGKYLNEKHPQGHYGVDLVSDRGTPVFPIAPGKVIETMVYAKGGNTVKVAHEDGNVVSYYAHLDSVSVRVGQEVDINTQLGTVGTSGNAKGTSPHLHYEVKVNNTKIDPTSVMGKSVGSLTKHAEMEIVEMLEKFAKF